MTVEERAKRLLLGACPHFKRGAHARDCEACAVSEFRAAIEEAVKVERERIVAMLPSVASNAGNDGQFQCDCRKRIAAAIRGAK